ncbi:hypothetical protein T4B_2784 [Trichinella pseudospiralis]|uniref:Uncharacterized protein n=1 Tax=Trichinella pseudospiralis TaxID=6337 RepID=A0A0V1JC79_TRIPS|nr:hypothetical protein T4B_2784 [Trichinella pseudospiralis]
MIALVQHALHVNSWQVAREIPGAFGCNNSAFRSSTKQNSFASRLSLLLTQQQQQQQQQHACTLLVSSTDNVFNKGNLSSSKQFQAMRR